VPATASGRNGTCPLQPSGRSDTCPLQPRAGMARARYSLGSVRLSALPVTLSMRPLQPHRPHVPATATKAHWRSRRQCARYSPHPTAQWATGLSLLPPSRRARCCNSRMPALSLSLLPAALSLSPITPSLSPAVSSLSPTAPSLSPASSLSSAASSLSPTTPPLSPPCLRSGSLLQ
jgi:hypothetical protein